MRPQLKAILGYVAFGLAAFAFGLYLTFPYDALRRFVVGQADLQGLSLQIGDLGPGLFGVTASHVKLAAKPMGDKPAEALQVDSVSVRPALFPLGLALRGSALGGSFHASVGALGPLAVHADFSDLDPTKGNFKGFTGIAAKGLASGELDLSLPKTAPGLDGKPHDPNLGEATGDVTLDLANFSIEGGQIIVPMYGTPTPMDLPKVVFGPVQAKLTFDKGQGKIDRLHARSDDLELNGTGTLRLARRIEYSELNVELSYKAEQALVSRLGLIGSALSMPPPDPAHPGFRVAHITGFLASPQLVQGR